MLACQAFMDRATSAKRDRPDRIHTYSHSHYVPVMKLTRKQTREALASVPLDTLLLGVQGAKSTPLTAKQRKFAEGVALGKTGAQAYREAYDSQGKAITQSHEGSRLKNNPAVAAQIQALALAQEAQRHSTPAALRALVIQQLTEHAINPDVQPAQRLRALELLGKVTEVAAFTERREVIKTTDAGAARAQLLDSLRSALKSGATDAAVTQPALGATQSAGPEPGAPLVERAQVAEGAGYVLELDGLHVPQLARAMQCEATRDDARPGAPPGFDAAGAHGAGTRAPLDQPRACAPTLLSNPDIQSPLLDETPPLPFPSKEGEGV